MKSFKEYLTESKKTYKFKVGIAGDLPEGFADRMETALERFSLVNMSNGKKTPIQESPLDFPQLRNIDVTYFEVEVNYPTTSQVLAEYLGTVCTVPHSNVIVRNPDEPIERIKASKESDTYETILTTEDLGGESAQQSVGENRVMDLLKELETARKERVATQEK
jgi:phosphoketolase|tara:strand:+ start:5501 stop:5992 length:492 start_codon:yes stop_codon:yes gene_type:complete